MSRLRLCLALAAGLLCATAQAQERWPTQPIRMILSVPPGGGTDLTARMIAPGVSQALGQPVVIESKSGAGGIVASDFVSHASPDGHTIGLVLSGHAANTILAKRAPYDIDKDFSPVSLLARWPNLIVVHPSVPAKNLAELIALAKAKPGALSYGTPGIGLSHHFAGELLKLAAGIHIVHVPYRGAAPALNDVLGGQIPIAITAITSGAPQARSGALRAIAVTGAQRSALLPEVPTVAEAGFADYDVSEWAAIIGPAKIPDDVIRALNAAFASTVKSPEINQKLREQASYEVIASSPEELRAFLAGEIKRMRETAERARIRVDE
jgi:tripartite-type tricarboxylate transporter receptor subunit TctC